MAQLSTGEIAIFVTLSTGFFGVIAAYVGSHGDGPRRAPDPPAAPDVAAIRAAVRAELEAERGP